MTTRKLCRRNNNGRVVPLPMDAIEEIIARLPVKQALRCKLLSKYYYNLIQTPSFINKHLNRSSDQRKILVVSKDVHEIAPDRMLSTLNDDDDGSVFFVPPTALGVPWYDCTTPVGSCNGLLVLQVMPDETPLTLCNPATREYLPLPRPRGDTPHLTVSPSSCYVAALGFCYDPKSDDYKLIKVGNNHVPCRSYLVEIWTMKTKTWKKTSCTPMPTLFLDKESLIMKPYYGLFVNGTLYWLAYAKDETDRDALVLSFDPTNDSFGQIVLPGDAILARRDKFDLNLIDFNGSLALSVGLMPSGESHNSTRLFDIWVLTTAAASEYWTKVLSIGPFPRDVRTTRVCINGKFVLQRIVNCISKFEESLEFILYDPHLNKVVKQSAADLFSTVTTAWSYTESLVSIR